jgi:hypothetical protein
LPVENDEPSAAISGRPPPVPEAFTERGAPRHASRIGSMLSSVTMSVGCPSIGSPKFEPVVIAVIVVAPTLSKV